MKTTKTLTHKIKLINSAIFMAISLSHLKLLNISLKKFLSLNVNIDVITKDVKNKKIDKKIASAILKIKILNLLNVYVVTDRNYHKKIDKYLKNQFANIYIYI